MKKFFVAVALLVGVALMSAQSRFTPAVEAKVDELMGKMTLDEKLTLIGGLDWMHTSGVPRLGIQPMKMSDGPQGLGTHGKSTAYPCAVLLTSTWNKNYAYDYGTSLARDCKNKGVNILLGPGVNIYRAPMCGRNFEYMGEDPFLASRIAVGYIKGLQDHGVMGVVKHFAFNNSDYDRNHISSDVDERTMNEIYFPAFKAAIQEAEVGGVMSSYNLWEGIYTTENPLLLKDQLKKNWGFKGIVMSDWESTHHAVPAARSGLDLEMPSAKYTNVADMKYYLTTGDVTMQMVDDKVRSILRTQIAFGFENGEGKMQPEKYDEQSAATALAVAREGIVLLKNTNNILPLNTKKYKHIIVTGKNANGGYVRGGGSGNVTPVKYVTLFEGLRKAGEAQGIEVEYVDTGDFLPSIAYTDNSLKENGFKAEYFKNVKLEGTPFVTRQEKRISYEWPGNGEFEGLPANNFSARWTGVLCSDKTFDYEFTLGGDDGFRLYIDNKMVIDNWADGSFRSEKYKMHMEAGKKYAVKVEFYQAGGTAAIEFFWNSPMGSTLNPKMVEALKKADLIIANVGFNTMTEGEGFDRTFELPAQDINTLDAVMASKKPVIAVLNSGGSVEMQGWEPSMKGLIWAGYAGQEAGTAIADIVFGKVNPSGRLPMTFEKKWADNPVYETYYDPDGDKHVEYKEGIFVGYRGYDKLNREVQYPFGYGLSYTTFKLSNMGVSKENSDGTVDVTVTLKNTGKRAGSQVVQAYVGKAGASPVERPSKELRGFEKVELKPGESATVTIKLQKEAFMYYDVKSHGFVKDAGDYNIMLGFSSRDIKLQKQISCK